MTFPSPSVAARKSGKSSKGSPSSPFTSCSDARFFASGECASEFVNPWISVSCGSKTGSRRLLLNKDYLNNRSLVAVSGHENRVPSARIHHPASDLHDEVPVREALPNGVAGKF